MWVWPPAHAAMVLEVIVEPVPLHERPSTEVEMNRWGMVRHALRISGGKRLAIRWGNGRRDDHPPCDWPPCDWPPQAPVVGVLVAGPGAPWASGDYEPEGKS